METFILAPQIIDFNLERMHPDPIIGPTCLVLLHE
jgi:hypothetical protein